jgi:hypothetical protein
MLRRPPAGYVHGAARPGDMFFKKMTLRRFDVKATKRRAGKINTGPARCQPKATTQGLGRHLRGYI